MTRPEKYRHALLAHTAIAVAWTRLNGQPTPAQGFGLLRFEINGTTEVYSSDLCDADFCEECHRSGKAVLAFSTIALFLTLLSFVALAKRKYDGTGRRPLLVILTLALAAHLIALTSWTGGCEAKLRDFIVQQGGTEDQVVPFVAWYLATAAMLFTGISLIFAIYGDEPDRSLEKGNWVSARELEGP